MEDGRLIFVRTKTGELLEIVNQAVAKEFVSLMEQNPRPLRLQFCDDNGKGFYINSVADFERLLAHTNCLAWSLVVDLQIDEESQFEGILAASLFDV